MWLGHREADGGNLGSLNPSRCERRSDPSTGKVGVVFDSAQSFLGRRENDRVIPHQADRALVDGVIDPKRPHGATRASPLAGSLS